MEALRRLRRNSTDTNVDRRLVTNILLSFLTTPRADAKRFEMLSLLATILSWNDTEREKAGLQRTGSATLVTSPSWTRSTSGGVKSPELPPKADETEVGTVAKSLPLLIICFSPFRDCGLNFCSQKQLLATRQLHQHQLHHLSFGTAPFLVVQVHQVHLAVREDWSH